MVQVSFTLPMAHSKVAEGAAAQLANKMGIEPAMVVHAKPMGSGFTFFVVYGRVNHLVDVSKVSVVERDYPLLSPKEANLASARALRRRLTVVGACIGSDAHTSASTRSSTSRASPARRGLEYYREHQGREHGAHRSRCRTWWNARAASRRTPCWSRRWSPSATRMCTTPWR
jgi:beta-lysine 5,6-aminomutase beta subunit